MKKAKNYSRKALSMLLAVIMIVSTCSCMFGIVASAAFDKTKYDAAITELVTALKCDTLLDGSYKFGTPSNNSAKSLRTNTLKADTYKDFTQLKTVFDKLTAALKLTNRLTTYPDTNSSTEFTNIDLIKDEVITSVTNAAKSDYTKYKMDAFLKSSIDTLYDLVGAQANSSGQWVENGNSGASTIWWNLVVSTTDWAGYLDAGKKYSDMKLQFTFKVGLSENYYSDCGNKYYAYTFHKGTTSPATTGYTATTFGNNVISTIDAYKAVADKAVSDGYTDFATLYNLYLNNRAAFNALDSDYTAKNNALNVKFGADSAKYKAKVFPNNEAYITVAANIDAAKESTEILEIADQWNAFVAANPSYGEYSSLGFGDGEALKADYSSFVNEYFNKINNPNSTIDEYLFETGYINKDYYTNFSDNVDAYAAEEVRVQIKDLMDKYEAEDGFNSFDEATQSADAGLMGGWMNTVEGFSPAVIGSIFNDDLTPQYSFQANFLYASNKYVAFFAENTTKTFDTAKTADVISVISAIPSNLSGLNAFYAEIKKNAGQEKADELLTDIMAAANALKPELYEFIGARFEAQVSHAYGVYKSMGDTSNFTVQVYYDLKLAFSGMEESIYNTLKSAANYDTYVAAEQRAQYAELLSDILGKYNNFAKTYGFSSFETTVIEDVVRETTDADLVRDEDYTVTDEKLNNVIDVVEKFLASPEFFGLIGKETVDADGNAIDNSLADMVMPLLENFIYSDSLINAIVNILYPVVQGEFDKVWATLPYQVSFKVAGIDLTVNVAYQKELKEILATGGMAIHPSGVAEILKKADATRYAENIKMLNKADLSWVDENVYDVDSSSLKLNWGVDETIDDPTTAVNEKAEAFYTAAGDALQGLAPLVKALLANTAWDSTTETIAKGGVDLALTTYNVEVDLQLTASPNNGYVNTLGPIFDLLGYTDYKNAAGVASAINTSEDLVRMLFGDLFGAIEGLLETPVANILDLLPNLLYATTFDMIPKLLSMLKTRIGYKATAEVLGLTTITALEDGVDIDIGTMFNLASMGLDTTNGLNGLLALAGINLETFNEGSFLTLGKLTQAPTNRTDYIYDKNLTFNGSEKLAAGKALHIEANRADVLYNLAEYAINALKSGELMDVLGAFMDTSSIDGIMSELNIKNSDAKDVIAAIVELVNSVKYDDAGYVVLPQVETPETVAALNPVTGEYEEVPYGYTFNAAGEIVEETDELYTEFWTKEKAEYVSSTLPELTEFILETLGLVGIDIEAEINNLLGSLYTKANIQAIVDLVAPLVSEGTVADVIEIVAPLVDDLDVEAIIDSIANFEVSDFVDGDRDAFVAELVRLVEPLVPVLKVFLISDDAAVTLVDGINIAGYNGYESAIVPVLEALGCDKTSIASYETIKTLDDAALVNAILNPILGLIDTIAADPINTVLAIVPNILYFVEVGAINEVLTNLLRPVYAVTDVIRPIYDLDISFDLDIAKMIDGLLSGIGGEDFSMPSYSSLVGILMKYGKTTEYTSVTGDTGYYLELETANTSELITVLAMTLIESVTVAGNIDGYLAFLQELNLITEDTALDLGDFLRGVSKLQSTDMAMFLVYYMVYGADVAVDHFDEVKGLVTEQMADILENFGGYTSGQYGEMADATDDLLQQLEDKLEDLGMGDGDSLNFFQQIVAAFKKFFEAIGKFFGL